MSLCCQNVCICPTGETWKLSKCGRSGQFCGHSRNPLAGHWFSKYIKQFSRNSRTNSDVDGPFLWMLTLSVFGANMKMKLLSYIFQYWDHNYQFVENQGRWAHLGIRIEFWALVEHQNFGTKTEAKYFPIPLLGLVWISWYD